MKKREEMVLLSNILLILEETRKGLQASGFTEDVKKLDICIQDVKIILDELASETDGGAFRKYRPTLISVVQVIRLVSEFLSSQL